jgi:hypothetical protein
MTITFKFNRMKYRTRAECQLAGLGAVPTMWQSMYLTKYKQKLHFTPLFPATKRLEGLCGIVSMASVNSVYGLGGLGFDSRQSKRFIPSPVRQDRMWCLLIDGYGFSFQGVKTTGV